MEARGGIGGAGRLAPMSADVPPVAGTMQMKIAADLSPQVLMGAAASGESAPEGETTSESPSEASVQPLIQSDDWNVIVVRIDSKDRDQAMDQIQSIAKKAGLQLKGAAGPEESRWLGVVLASDVAGRDEVVNAMEGVGASSGYVTETPSVDSPEAMFIKAARESLKHPTRSELHHGKVFVALPSSTATNEENRVVAAVEKAAPENSESTTSERSALPSAALENPSTPSAKVSVRAVQDVTLVVFEFSNGEKSGPNSSGQQI
jgi:phosphoribosylformylglycinamidine (FGAM) synthase PurS component